MNFSPGKLINCGFYLSVEAKRVLPRQIVNSKLGRMMDYEKIGLKAGLEVHQQLLTERKMFCNCPSGRYTKTHDGVVLRHMRPTLSELGEYDGTALMEAKTKKNIIYLLHKSNVCTYEIDDTPPFLVNQQALDVAIEQCLMLGCDIVDEVHIARKQYLDGSIPTGFQRTAIVGVEGKLPFLRRTLSIIQVSVEEDSCREVSDRGHLVVWRTDRLGMPLIETVTAPELTTPQEVEQAILLIGRVCRSTGHVRVGLGASRQDVNVSVRGGRRVEIKGVPKASWAPRLVHGEAVRQCNLLALRDELLRRGLRTAQDVLIDQKDVTEQLVRSKLTYLRRENWQRFVREDGRRLGFELGEGPYCVRAVRLPGLAGVLSWPTQPEHTFAHELAGRIRVIAGLDQQPILVHSEKWPDYADAQRELRRLKRFTKCADNDSLVLVWGPKEDTQTAAEEIRLRLVDALDGVPNETRQPFEDGSTDFERILPGPDRMYPDTDSPPTRMTRPRVERLRKALPHPPWVRQERYADVGVPTPTIHFLIRRNGAKLVDQLVDKGCVDLRTACFFVGERLKGYRRKGIGVDQVSAERWEELFLLLQRRSVLWDVCEDLVRLLVSSTKPLEQIVLEKGWGESKLTDWKKQVKDSLVQMQPSYQTTSQGRFRFHMGCVMHSLRGKIQAKRVAEVVHEVLRGK